MEVEVVTRGCGELPVGAPDTCVSVSDLAASNPELSASLSILTSRFNSVTYTGEQCLRDPNAAVTFT